MPDGVLERWLEEVIAAPGATALSDVATARRVLLDDALRALPVLAALEGPVVDAAGSRARRTATLETLARRTAQRASGTGRRVALDPMTPVERKIVHEALKDDPEVQTMSEGTEPNRYVVVLPRHFAD